MSEKEGIPLFFSRFFYFALHPSLLFASSNTYVDESLNVDVDLHPWAVAFDDVDPEGVEEHVDLNGQCTNDEGKSDSSVSKFTQESHEETKTDENHNVHVHVVGVSVCNLKSTCIQRSTSAGHARGVLTGGEKLVNCLTLKSK